MKRVTRERCRMRDIAKILNGCSVCLVTAVLLAACSKGAASDSKDNVYQEMLNRVERKRAAEAGIQDVRSAVRLFQTQLGRLPTNLTELVRFGYVETLPRLPEGYQIDYNPAIGLISVNASESSSPK
ncbi:MAG: hypothetical protein EOL87_14630 [Spartobacteria bacterium]|nr:hypothetical protein [Spartobacteria bacterium]